MQSKRILVTGSNGQLGRALQRLGAVSPHTYLFTDLEELDITDRRAVLDYVTREKIDLVFPHCSKTLAMSAAWRKSAADFSQY